MRDTVGPDSVTQVLSHVRKNHVWGLQRMRGLSVVFTCGASGEVFCLHDIRECLYAKSVVKKIYNA